MRWVLNVIAENRNSSVGSGRRDVDHAPSATSAAAPSTGSGTGSAGGSR